MGKILKGLPVVEDLKENIRESIREIKKRGITPALGVIRVGNRPDDLAYEKRILKSCHEIDLKAEIFELEETITSQEFDAQVKEINKRDNVHGILLFRPLPQELEKNLDFKEIISPDKDIDGMHPDNLRKVFEGDTTGHLPCTPEAVLEILKFYHMDLEGAHVVIVNRSLVLGKPLAMLLLKANATVTLCHSKTKDLKSITRNADIVVTGIGRGEFFTKEYFSENSIVIDVGINYLDGKMCGDVMFDEVEPCVRAITPVPGGVGTVTSMLLLKHVVDSIS